MTEGTQQRACMFCGAPRMTKTHLIAQRAIRQHLPSTSSGIERNDVWFDASSGYQARHQDYHFDPLSQQVKRACDPCNRVWMGGIENDVAADVIALALGESRELDGRAASRLAVWATVVAMLRATQDPGEPFFDAADVRAIRETSQLPSGYVVWLIEGESRWDFPSRHQRILLSVGGRTHEPTHLTWFWIGRSLYMVNHPIVSSLLSRMNVFGDAVQILAPYGGYPITWPFGRAVLHDAMVDVTSSFFDVGNVPVWRGFEPREG